MTYQQNPSDPLGLLAATAKSLMDQYDANTITLQQFKDAVQTQIVAKLNTLDMTRPADDSYYLISTAIAMTGAQD